MKLIGIMGKPGSGKTTFSNYLGNKDNVGVIHVDSLVAEVKKKYFKMILQPKENNTTENAKNNPKLKVEVKEMFYKNKILFKLWLKIRSMFVQKELENKINELKLDGKDLIVIDDLFLTSHKKLFEKCDRLYVLDRDYLERRNGLRQRDGLTRKELRVSDIPYSVGNIKIPSGDNVINIFNNGTIEDLEKKAEEEYEKIGEISFDERYKIKSPEIRLKTVAKSIGKSRKAVNQEHLKSND